MLHLLIDPRKMARGNLGIDIYSNWLHFPVCFKY